MAPGLDEACCREDTDEGCEFGQALLRKHPLYIHIIVVMGYNIDGGAAMIVVELYFLDLLGRLSLGLTRQLFPNKNDTASSVAFHAFSR